MESEAEHFEDFGASLTEPELDALLARARATGDRELRLLVKQYRGLRRATEWLLDYLAEREGPAALDRSGIAALARSLVQRTGSSAEDHDPAG